MIRRAPNYSKNQDMVTMRMTVRKTKKRREERRVIRRAPNYSKNQDMVTMRMTVRKTKKRRVERRMIRKAPKAVKPNNSRTGRCLWVFRWSTGWWQAALECGEDATKPITILRCC